MLHHYIGWIGAFLFAICAVPQVIQTWRTKKAGDLSWLFLIFWLLGEILTFTYIVIDDILLKITHFPLYINYLFNIILVLYLIYAKKVYK
ncbi:MAG: PQ-loop domain-containing transporter [Parcubacteria group bacterium]